MSSVEPPAPGRGRYDRQASASERARLARAGILEAVRELLSGDEQREVSVADVVGLTHIGRNTFYGHFEDVGQAVGEVAKACLQEVDAALTSPVQGTPHAALQAFVGQWFAFVTERSGTVRIAAQMDREGLRQLLERALQGLHQVGANAGVFRRVLEPERLQALGSVLLDASVSVAMGRGRAAVSAAAVSDAVLALCR